MTQTVRSPGWPSHLTSSHRTRSVPPGVISARTRAAPYARATTSPAQRTVRSHTSGPLGTSPRSRLAMRFSRPGPDEPSAASPGRRKDVNPFSHVLTTWSLYSTASAVVPHRNSPTSPTTTADAELRVFPMMTLLPLASREGNPHTEPPFPPWDHSTETPWGEIQAWSSVARDRRDALALPRGRLLLWRRAPEVTSVRVWMLMSRVLGARERGYPLLDASVWMYKTARPLLSLHEGAGLGLAGWKLLRGVARSLLAIASSRASTVSSRIRSSAAQHELQNGELAHYRPVGFRASCCWI